jgi:hypothetical protein
VLGDQSSENDFVKKTNHKLLLFLLVFIKPYKQAKLADLVAHWANAAWARIIENGRQFFDIVYQGDNGLDLNVT